MFWEEDLGTVHWLKFIVNLAWFGGADLKSQNLGG